MYIPPGDNAHDHELGGWYGEDPDLASLRRQVDQIFASRPDPFTRRPVAERVALAAALLTVLIFLVTVCVLAITSTR